MINEEAGNATLIELRSQLFKRISEKIMALPIIDDVIQFLRLPPKQYVEVTPKSMVKLIRLCYLLKYGDEYFLTSMSPHKGYKPEKAIIRINTTDIKDNEPYLPNISSSFRPLPLIEKAPPLSKEEKEAKREKRKAEKEAKELEKKKEAKEDKIKNFEDIPFVFRPSQNTEMEKEEIEYDTNNEEGRDIIAALEALTPFDK